MYLSSVGPVDCCERVRMPTCGPIDRATPFLLPPSVDDWLGKDHLARFVVDIVDQLDLSPLTEQYRGAGSAAYHPAVMLRRNSDPDVPIDTNHIERALRVIPMGRRNWLFCWTELGARHVGIMQSLLATCRLHDIDPYDYLVDVLQR